MLPLADTEERFAAVRGDEEVLRPGVDRLCGLLGVDTAMSRVADGSLPVYSVDDLVLKLFPPVFLAEWRVEVAVLRAVSGLLPTPTPRVHAAGRHDGWGYVLMSRLSGLPLESVWEQTTAAERDRLAGHLGETISVLHGVAPPWCTRIDARRYAGAPVYMAGCGDCLRDRLCTEAGAHAASSVFAALAVKLEVGSCAKFSSHCFAGSDRIQSPH